MYIFSGRIENLLNLMIPDKIMCRSEHVIDQSVISVTLRISFLKRII